MKRSEALAPLSRDYHVALEAALRLRRATAADVELAAARFAAFWSRAGAHHFEIEEELILPRCPRATPSGAPPSRGCAPSTPRSARALGRWTAPTWDDATALGEMLSAHVRFEERVLFALFERALDDDRLAALAAAVDAAERSRVRP